MQEQLSQLSDNISVLEENWSAASGATPTHGFISLIDDTLLINERAMTSLENAPDGEIPMLYEGIPMIIGMVKDLAVLGRDTIVERLKGQVLREDNKISQADLIELAIEGDKVLKGACQEAQEEIQKVLKKYHSIDSKEAAKIVEQSRTVLPPHEVYQQQLTVLKQQLSELSTQSEQIVSAQQIMSGIQRLLLDKIDKEKRLYNQLSEHLDAVITQLDKNEEKTDIKQIVAKAIDEMHLSGENSVFLAEARRKIEELPTIDLMVDTAGGHVITRDVDLHAGMKNWMDAQYMPQIVEIIDSSSQLHTRVNMALNNIKNRLSLQEESLPPEAVQDIKQVLFGLKQDIDKVKVSIATNSDALTALVSEEVRISKLYKDEEFLQLGLQGSINQVLQNQNSRVQSLTKWMKDKWQKVQVTAQEWRYPTHLSRREALALCLDTRQVDEASEIYDQVFQNNSFISDVFIVPRSSERRQIEKAIEYWRSGNSAMIALTGAALCGKTTMLTKIKNQLFDKKTVELLPDTKLKVRGKTIKSQRSLKPVLDEVLKQVEHGETLITIDDLELWQDESISVIENVNDLLAFSADHGEKVLIMVTMGVRLYQKLNTYVHIGDHFYSSVDMSLCPLSEAIKAIDVRHCATHKTLVNNSGNVLSQSEILSTARRIYSDARGNIGNMLRKWTYATHDINGGEVTFVYRHESLPKISSEDGRAILDLFLLHKRLTNKQLIQKYGKEIYEELRPAINGLINDRLLLIDNANYMHINPAVICDVEHQLRNEHAYVSNYKQTNIL